MIENNVNNDGKNSIDGRPPSNASGPSPGINPEQNFFQQLFTADHSVIQQQQEQPLQEQSFFFPNQGVFPGQPTATGMMGFDQSHMMAQTLTEDQAQQQQVMQANLFPFSNNNDDSNMNLFMKQMSAQSANNAIQNPQFQHVQGIGVQHTFLQQHDGSAAQPAPPMDNMMQQNQTEAISDIGGVSVPPMAAGTPTILHVEAAANAAALVAAPSRKRKSSKKDNATNKSRKFLSASTEQLDTSQQQPNIMSASATALIDNAMKEVEPQIVEETAQHHTEPLNTATMTPEQKAQSSRDRNREHARCTRLRKKAYVNKLKELVDGLHVERSENTRKRLVAVQTLAGLQEARRKVIHIFLGYHARYQGDVDKWRGILEEDFWMKQPVTPFRSFRRCEIDKGSRVLKGINAMIGDAASMSVMIETIGSRNLRWLQRKRDDFLTRVPSSEHMKVSKRPAHSMPQNIMQNGRLQQAVSSMSSSSGSSAGSSDDIRGNAADTQQQQQKNKGSSTEGASTTAMDKTNGKKVSSSSSSNDTRKFVAAQLNNNANDFHDYHAPSLPDPLLDSGGSSPESDSPHDGDSDNCVVTKHKGMDSFSGDDIKSVNKDVGKIDTPSDAGCKPSIDKEDSKVSKLPPNIARSGGISHNVTVIAIPPTASLPNGHAQLSRAPITAIPPFAGIGKKANTTEGSSSTTQSQNGSKQKPTSHFPKLPIDQDDNRRKNNGRSSDSHSNHRNKNNIITIDNDTTSSQSSNQKNRGIQAYYHINEDDMCMTNDVLMCPFTFRSLDAVWCGALAECVMPGMLRVCFSANNKLKSVEMIFDAMGFCQQLEHASGNLGMAQIIPNCLEMALVPNSEEARVITLAKEPFAIVSVNEAWTRITGYTQLDVEGKDLSILHGERTDPEAGVRSGLPTHDFASVCEGISACSVNFNYDVKGREFLNFMCSYPLTNPNNEVTHMLHVCQELPARG